MRGGGCFNSKGRSFRYLRIFAVLLFIYLLLSLLLFYYYYIEYFVAKRELMSQPGHRQVTLTIIFQSYEKYMSL